MIDHLVLIAGASLFALPGLMAPSMEADEPRPAGPPGPTGQVPTHKLASCPARREHRRLRGRVHPAPRVASAGQRPVRLVRVDHRGGRSAEVSPVRVVRAFGRELRQQGFPGGGRAGQRGEHHAARRVRGRRLLRIPAAALARNGRTGADCSGRAHERGAGARIGRDIRDGAARGAVLAALRDALVSHGRGGNRAALMRLRPRPSMTAILEDSGEPTLPTAAQPCREIDGRDPEPAPHDELWPVAEAR